MKRQSLAHPQNVGRSCYLVAISAEVDLFRLSHALLGGNPSESVMIAVIIVIAIVTAMPLSLSLLCKLTGEIEMRRCSR